MPSIENKPVKRYSRSLGLKILLAIVLTIIILGLLATLTTYFTSRNVLVDVQTTDLINATITESQETAQVFTQSQNLVKSIASQANIVGFMSGQATEMDMEHVVKHSLLEDYNIGQAYSSIYLINSDGLTILSTDKTFEGKNYGFRDYFIKALAGEPYVDVSVGVTSNKLGYYFSHPITNSNNQVVGVAVVKLKPEIVSQTISNQTKEGIEVMLVDEYGVVIYSPEEDKVFHSLGPIPSTILKTITEKKRYGNIKIEALGYSAVQDRLNNYQEPSSVSIRDEYDGEDEVLSFSQVGSLPFYIVSEMKISQASQFATNTALTLAVFVLTAALMAAIMALSMSLPSAPSFSSISLRTAGWAAAANFACSDGETTLTFIFLDNFGNPRSDASITRETPRPASEATSEAQSTMPRCAAERPS